MLDQGLCGDGWESRPDTDTCYSFIDNDQMNRDQAIQKCKELGGTLASIQNFEEEEYLDGRTTLHVISIKELLVFFFKILCLHCVLPLNCVTWNVRTRIPEIWAFKNIAQRLKSGFSVKFWPIDRRGHSLRVNRPTRRYFLMGNYTRRYNTK